MRVTSIMEEVECISRLNAPNKTCQWATLTPILTPTRRGTVLSPKGGELERGLSASLLKFC